MKILNYKANGEVQSVAMESFTFSGGEEHVRLNIDRLDKTVRIEIFERLTDSSKIVRLMMAVDALRRIVGYSMPIELVIPYFPYARQDRVCVEGEALGAVVMANLINGLNFAKVTIWDAHSDVSPALIHRVINVPQYQLLQGCDELSNLLTRGELTLVSPDAGASKKTVKIAEVFNGVPGIIQAQKVRNLKTGEITHTEIAGDVKGKNVLITDDICDGGRTFIELAKVLKQQGANKIILFVTHGIFSRGFTIFNGLIDKIYTTDSIRTAAEFQVDNQVALQIIEM